MPILKKSSEILLQDSGIEIKNLCLTHPDILSYFKNLNPEQHVTEAIKAFEVGISVISRLQQSQNLDFIEAKFGEIMCRTQENFDKFDQSMQILLENNLNPTKAGSFLSQAHVLINAQTDRVSSGLTQVLRDTREAITAEAAKLLISREQMDHKMDPDNNLGYLSAVIQKINSFEGKLNQQFCETDTASFVGRLQTIMNSHFGTNGAVLALIQKQLAVDPNSLAAEKTPLNQVYHGLRQEIAELRDAMMRIAGQKEMLEQTSKKGFPFEAKVFEELQRIARPFGEVVEDTSLRVEAISGSKKGDYIYRIANSDASIVIDAKNYGKLKSLPAMLQYLKDASRDRDSKIGIIVVPEKKNLQKQIGSWNVYGKNIITPLEYLEISIKFSKFMIQLNSSDSENINLGLIQQKLETVQRKMKEITSVKSKLTKLSNGVAASVADIQESLDSIRQDINDKLLEIQSEFKKS